MRRICSFRWGKKGGGWRVCFGFEFEFALGFEFVFALDFELELKKFKFKCKFKTKCKFKFKCKFKTKYKFKTKPEAAPLCSPLYRFTTILRVTWSPSIRIWMKYIPSAKLERSRFCCFWALPFSSMTFRPFISYRLHC